MIEKKDLLWRRGWDSNHCWLLKTKNLTEFCFRTIRQIRTKTLVETRIEHAAGPGDFSVGNEAARERPFSVLVFPFEARKINFKAATRRINRSPKLPAR